MEEKKEAGEVYGKDVGKTPLEEGRESGGTESRRCRAEAKGWGLGLRSAEGRRQQT